MTRAMNSPNGGRTRSRISPQPKEKQPRGINSRLSNSSSTSGGGSSSGGNSSNNGNKKEKKEKSNNGVRRGPTPKPINPPVKRGPVKK